MTNPRRRTATLRGGALVLLLVGSTALASCTESVKPKSAPPVPVLTTATPTPTDTSTPTPTATPTPIPTNPLTGQWPVPTGTVIAVKIDDTGNGRPQYGIDQADIVYIEQAEGGLSRLVAVFASKKPTVVEPVRSVRASDPELLSQYGAITLVASGGGGDALPTLYKSILHAVIDDRGDKGFSFDYNRQQPYNTEINLATVTRNVKGNPVQSIGFLWSNDVPTGKPGTALATTVGAATLVTFRYDSKTARYDRIINGVVQKAADGKVISTPNVIVQFCNIVANSHDVDVNGAVSKYTHTIGMGKVAVFRNGVRVDGTWSRPSLKAGTTLTAADGTPIGLAPGGAWVLLVANGTALNSH